MNFIGTTFRYIFVSAIWSISSSLPVNAASLSLLQNYTEQFLVFTTLKPPPQLKYKVKPFIWIRYTVPPANSEEEYSETEIQLSIFMPIALVTLVCFVCFILIRRHCISARNESVPTPPPPRVISCTSTTNRRTSRALSRRNSEAALAARHKARLASRMGNLRDKPPDYSEVVNKEHNKYPTVPLDTLQIPPPNYEESMKY